MAPLEHQLNTLMQDEYCDDLVLLLQSLCSFELLKPSITKVAVIQTKMMVRKFIRGCPLMTFGGSPEETELMKMSIRALNL